MCYKYLLPFKNFGKTEKREVPSPVIKQFFHPGRTRLRPSFVYIVSVDHLTDFSIFSAFSVKQCHVFVSSLATMAVSIAT